MKKRRGMSLIVLIVTIIVMIILASVVILTLSKNNLIEGAKEAKFKQDVSSFQDELSLIISKEYIDLQGNRNSKINATEYDDIIKFIPSFTKEYENKLIIQDDNLMYIKSSLNEKEVKWLKDIEISQKIVIPNEWKYSIASITKDGVPIPKGFSYLTGTKDTGTVIQDEKGNQFVWIPTAAYIYTKYFLESSGLNSGSVSDDTLPDGISNESTDVEKYGGFYIGRYEAGTPDGTETTRTNSIGIPICKSNVVVWTNIDYDNAKASAESMISNEYVETGLITGTA